MGTITINRDDRGVWRISDPEIRRRRGEDVHFELGEGATEETVAHFQFREGLFAIGGDEIERAVLPDDKKLDLTIVADARQTMLRDERIAPAHHYAIFITPDNKWVHGTNPPPKIDVGG